MFSSGLLHAYPWCPGDVTPLESKCRCFEGDEVEFFLRFSPSGRRTWEQMVGVRPQLSVLPSGDSPVPWPSYRVTFPRKSRGPGLLLTMILSLV